MKRIISGIVLALLLTGMLTLTVNFQIADASHFNQNTTISTYKEKHIDVSFPTPQVVKIGHYDWLRMENCSYFTKLGQPMLPVRSVVVKLPERSIITNISVKVDESLLQGSFSILPVPSPSIVSSQIPGNFSEDPVIYKYKAEHLFPEKWYVCRDAHGMDAETATRVKYLILNLFPLRFLPAKDKVIRAENVSITVNYIETEILASLTELENLIITSSTLESYAIQLAEWKNDTGISSKVLTTTWIYANYEGVDNQEKIRNCVKDFVAAYGIIYVTIFGDADQVPVRYVYVPDDYDTYTPTDLYYADLDGTWDDNGDGLYADQRYDEVDGIPDVYIGRIPPSLIEYAQVAVDKIIGYQKQFRTSQDWSRRIVLAAGTGSGDGVTNPFGIAFPFLKDYIANITTDKDVIKLYESAGNLSTASLASEINKGSLFVNFAGHGNPSSWLLRWIIPIIWSESFSWSDADGLTNGYKLPVVTTLSCSTARFDDEECIGEVFVLNPNGGGIAYFGPTRVAWGYPDEWVTTGLMGEMDWRIYEAFYEGHTRLGQMWGETVGKYVQYHIWDYEYASVYDVKTFMEFVLLGDPTLRICPTLFEDGFESSDFSQWSGTRVSSGETATVVNTLTHHGTSSAMFMSNGDGRHERAYCYKTIPSSTELYARGHFYVASSGISDNSDRFYFIVFKGGGTGVAFAGWRQTGGVVKWNLIIRDGTSWKTVYSSNNPSLDQWYCVELRWKEVAANGIGELWVDGVLVCSISGKNTAAFGDVNRVEFGLPDIVGCGTTQVYGYSTAVSQTYIGPEPSKYIFKDNFESGDFSRWSGSGKSSGESATVVNTLSYEGTYSAMFTSNGHGGHEHAYCYVGVSSSTELYARGYFYVSASGIADNNDRFYLIVFKAGGSGVAFAGWRQTGGVVKWNLLIRDGTGWVGTYSIETPLLNQWYSVEIHWIKDSSNGGAELWIDGALVCSITGKNTAYYGGVNRVRFGLADMVNVGGTVVCADDVAVSRPQEQEELWFFSIDHMSYDTDYDLYDDAVEVKMDVDATDGTLEVTVYGYLIYPSGGTADFSYSTCTITGIDIEYGYLDFYVPWDGEEGWYDIELYLFDEDGNLEEHHYDEAFAYLYPPGYGPPPGEWNFEDGFESGDFSGWNGIRVSSGETATVVDTLSHSSTYSAMFTSSDDDSHERACCYWYTDPEIWEEKTACGCFMVTTSGIADDNDRFYFIVFKAGGNGVAFAGWRQIGGVVKWSLITRDGTGWVTAYSEMSPSLNQWYFVELTWWEDSESGGATLFVDGTPVCSIWNKDTSAFGSVNRYDFGLADMVYCGSTTIYVDDAKAGFVGPE